MNWKALKEHIEQMSAEDLEKPVKVLVDGNAYTCALPKGWVPNALLPSLEAMTTEFSS